MTATETARKAIAVVAKLSPTMTRAVRYSTSTGESRSVGAPRRTVDALAARGIAFAVGTGRGGELTDFGRVVLAVLVDGADAVLAEAERKDAKVSAAEYEKVAQANAAARARAAEAVRAADRKLAEEAERERIERAEGRCVAAEFIAKDDTTDDDLSTSLDVSVGRDLPVVQAFRQAVMDELHTRALEEHARQSRPGPHFCNPKCNAAHATPWDRAGDAAELCDDPRHFELYPDTSPESIRAHVAAHLDRPSPIYEP